MWEWSIRGDESGIRVVVPETCSSALLAMLSDAANLLGLDPYRNHSVLPQNIPLLHRRLTEAIEKQRHTHREEARRRLRIREIDPWAETIVAEMEGRDALLHVLLELRSLCELANQEGASLRLSGD